MLAREHLDDEAADGPDVGLGAVRGLLDDLGGHPEDRALQRWPVRAVAADRCILP